MLRVRDVMTTSVVSVGPSTPLKEVARLLVDHRISGVPVVDPDGRVLGLVTEADFLVKEQAGEGSPHRRFGWLLGESTETRAQAGKFAATNAGEAMTAPPITIEPDQSITEAARRMSERRVNRLPVLENGKLVGIVTRADIVRVYVRSDADLVQTVREDVLRRMLWLDPAAFVVEARDGRVSISGSVGRRSTAAMTERFIRMVPGVVDVEADIDWSIDDSEIEPPSEDPVFPFSQG